QIQVAYAIGVARPFSILVETFGTEAPGLSPMRIEELVQEHFDLRPAAILRDLDLRRPIYQKTAAYGHFGRDDHDFTWERTDKAAVLREAAGLAAATATTTTHSRTWFGSDRDRRPCDDLRQPSAQTRFSSLCISPARAGSLRAMDEPRSGALHEEPGGGFLADRLVAAVDLDAELP